MNEKNINKALALIKEALEEELNKQKEYRVETLKDMIECLTDLYKEHGNFDIKNTNGDMPTISVSDDKLIIY